VISASVLGDLKTAFQVAMVIALIAVHGHPVWLWVLIYVTVFITVLSGADYFFGLRRHLSAGGSRQAET
jgi:CDP-diacylglycerol---glycerol-3-phosphate 3-phosphatidyltransferase